MDDNTKVCLVVITLCAIAVTAMLTGENHDTTNTVITIIGATLGGHVLSTGLRERKLAPIKQQLRQMIPDMTVCLETDMRLDDDESVKAMDLISELLK